MKSENKMIDLNYIYLWCCLYILCLRSYIQKVNLIGMHNQTFFSIWLREENIDATSKNFWHPDLGLSTGTTCYHMNYGTKEDGKMHQSMHNITNKD